MSGRRRIRLVPPGAVEVFEARAVLYLDAETGDSFVALDVSTPDGQPSDAQLHEILGVLRMAEDLAPETLGIRESGAP